MDLNRLLNGPLPPMRTPPAQEANHQHGAARPRLASLTSFADQAPGPRPLNKYARGSLTRAPTSELSLTFSELSHVPLCDSLLSPPLSTSSGSHDDGISLVPRSFTDLVLCSASRVEIEGALEAFRRESHSGESLFSVLPPVFSSIPRVPLFVPFKLSRHPRLPLANGR